MKISPVIFGASGMVGKGVLLECLDSPDVEKVLTVSRRPLGIAHPKLTEIITGNVNQLQPWHEQLKNYDACFFCLGVSSVGMNEEKYAQVTYELTMNVALQMLDVNPQMVFCYVSGQGTDTHGSMMWARVKGRTEDAIIAAGFKAAYMFRPGIIIPLRGIRSRTQLYNLAYVLMRPFFPLMMKSASVTDTTRIGQAMIKAATVGYEKTKLENRDINELSRR